MLIFMLIPLMSTADQVLFAQTAPESYDGTTVSSATVNAPPPTAKNSPAPKPGGFGGIFGPGKPSPAPKSFACKYGLSLGPPDLSQYSKLDIKQEFKEGGNLIVYCKQTKCCYDEKKFCGSQRIEGVKFRFEAFKGSTPNGFCGKNEDCPLGGCNYGICCPSKFDLNEIKCPEDLLSTNQFPATCTASSQCNRGTCTEVLPEKAANGFDWPKEIRRQCCEYPPTHKCLTGNTPVYPTDGSHAATASNCPENRRAIRIPNGPSYDVCCPIIYHPVLGKEPKNIFHQCTGKCGPNEICAASSSKDGKKIDMKHCYEAYPPTLKCPTGDLPLLPTDGTYIATDTNCPANSKALTIPNGVSHKVCCPVVFHPGLGKEPKDIFQECTDKCGDNEICDISARRDGQKINMKHCYVVYPPNVKCPTGDFPVLPTGGTYLATDKNCPKDFSARKTPTGFADKVCCPIIFHPVLGTWAKDPYKECTDKCGANEFCDASARKDGQKISMKHCYDVPLCPTKDPVPVLHGAQLFTCDKGCNKDGGKTMFCHKGKPDVCCPLDCPYWKKSKNGISINTCTKETDCSKTLCTNVPNVGKMCCPVDKDLMCPAGQYPVLENFEKPAKCPKGTTEYNGACCRDFVSKLLRASDKSTVHPVDAKKTCNANEDCGEDEFCDQSTFLEFNAKVKGQPAHCYKMEKWGTISPKKEESDQKGIVLCEPSSGDCYKEHMRNCVSFPSAPTTLVCYLAECPFWKTSTEIPKSRIKDCKDDSACDKGDQCSQVGFPEKQCCPVDPAALCSTGLFPRLDSNGQPVTSCDSENDFEHKALDKTFCCGKTISKDYDSVGTEVEPSDYSKTCASNKDCAEATFCGESILKGSKKTLPNKEKHCYKDPQGAGGILKEETESGFTACESHADCKASKGEYCNTFLGFKKGICHLALCPLAKALPKGQFTECKENDGCGKDEYCHEVVPGKGIRSCCGIDDGNFCPGGLVPQNLGENSCQVDMFSYSLSSSKMIACCHSVISKTLKDAGSIWKLAERQEIATKMDSLLCSSTTCAAGFFCDESVTMKGESVRNNVKHCYPVPKSYGKVGGSVKSCEKDSDCTLSDGELCDNNLKDVNKGFDGKAAICAKFKCPLTKSVFTKVCTENSACGDDAMCHPLGTVKYKACCAVDAEYRCPGGLFPFKVNGMLRHRAKKEFKCEDSNYMVGNGNTKGDKCCPKVISRDIFATPYDGKDANKVEPVEQDKICEKAADCTEYEFCGESMLLSDSVKELRINGKPVYHCYKTPNCAGAAVKSGNYGLKLCTSASSACGANEICDFDLKSVNSGEYDLTGLCCKYDCKGPTDLIKEIKEGTTGVAGRTCTCSAATSAQEFCDDKLVNDDSTIEVCENTGVYGTYRLCKYEREPFKCPSDKTSPLRDKNYQSFGCESDIDCRKYSRRLVSASETPRRSVCSVHSQKDGESQKVCCTGDFCSDWNTERLNENVCQKDSECGLTYNGKQLTGKCEADPFGIDKTLHCCPYADQIDQDQSVDVINIYRTQKNCTKLADCIGERRFCDPIENKCMYNLRSHNLKKRKGSCTVNDILCGDSRTVCMIIPPADSESVPQCYAHPFDECDANSACGQDQYCAPPIGTDEVGYENEFRKCHKLPSGALREDDVVGLKQCKNKADCGSDDLFCNTNANPPVAGKPGYGFCENKVQLKCRGRPSIKYKSGKLLGCSKNSDCGASQYCDMDLERPPSLSKNQGICCSRPSNCGGETPEQEVGLKICGDSGCDEANGEVCITKIDKAPESNWKSNDGVCCKMSCPKFDHAEVADVDFFPAGPICTSDNCKNNTEAFQTCVRADNATYERCCTYKRKTDLCPSNSKGVLRVDLNAKTCSSKSDCPSNAQCLSGWCCEQDFCPDGKTLRLEQKTCAEAKDCAQPKGAEAACNDGYCCPKMYNNLIQKPYVTDMPCLTVNDCPHSRMFCHKEKGQCVHFGSRTELESDKKCSSDNKTCPSQDGLPGVCVFPNDNRQDLPSCWMNPLAQKSAKTGEATTAASEEEGSKAGMAVGIIAVILIVLGAAGVGIFVYYKKSSAKRKKKKEAAAKAEKEKEKASPGKEKEGKGKSSPAKKEKPAEEAGGALKAAEQTEGKTGGDSTTGGTPGGSAGGPMFITL